MSETIVVSQLGARMHYGVPRIFAQAGQLERFYTDICAVRGWPRALSHMPQGALPDSLKRLAGRVPDGIPLHKIHSFPMMGLVSGIRRTAASAADGSAVTLAVARHFSNLVVDRGFGAALGFYGIAGECLEQIEAAGRQGLWTAVEQINAPRVVLDRLVLGEARLHRGWEEGLGADPWAEAFARREAAEWAAADIVVCPSEFVRRGVEEAGGPVERCVVVPYGVDARFRSARERVWRDGPLRVLTVGQVGLRKGSPYVFELARLLQGRAVFRMVGSVAVLPERQDAMRKVLDLAGPTPRSAMADHYRWADVFLLPSVCEGSATVIYEAMAAGLPVVTTPNAGSVVRDGIDGFVCPGGDVDAMSDRIAFLARDRQAVDKMGRTAAEASTDYDLAGYGRRLLTTLAPLRERFARSPRAQTLRVA